MEIGSRTRSSDGTSEKLKTKRKFHYLSCSGAQVLLCPPFLIPPISIKYFNFQYDVIRNLSHFDKKYAWNFGFYFFARS